MKLILILLISIPFLSSAKQEMILPFAEFQKLTVDTQIKYVTVMIKTGRSLQQYKNKNSAQRIWDVLFPLSHAAEVNEACDRQHHGPENTQPCLPWYLFGLDASNRVACVPRTTNEKAHIDKCSQVATANISDWPERVRRDPKIYGMTRDELQTKCSVYKNQRYVEDCKAMLVGLQSALQSMQSARPTDIQPLEQQTSGGGSPAVEH